MQLSKQDRETLQTFLDRGEAMALVTDPTLEESVVRPLLEAHIRKCDMPVPPKFEIFDSPYAAMEAYAEATPNNAMYGHLDCGWLMGYMYYRTHKGEIESTEKAVTLLEVSQHTGWMWANENVMIVTRRPVEIHLVPRKNQDGTSTRVLHNKAGLAIRYVDGTGVAALNGVVVPKWAVLEPYNLEKVMSVTNTEVRNELLKLGGPDVLERTLDIRVLEQAEINPGGQYKLYQFEIAGHTRTCLRGYCPSSGKEFNEYVPNDRTTVAEALRWREWGTISIPGLAPTAYLLPAVRT